MINKLENQTILEFGNGDICISYGYYINNEDKKINSLTFNNQSPREIWTEGDIKVGKKYKIKEFPVIMTFSKDDSIDVLIEALSNIKQSMKLEQNQRD